MTMPLQCLHCPFPGNGLITLSLWINLLITKSSQAVLIYDDSILQFNLPIWSNLDTKILVIYPPHGSYRKQLPYFWWRHLIENIASSIVACWTMFTELLPGNALIKSVTILQSSCLWNAQRDLHDLKLAVSWSTCLRFLILFCWLM
jgi:hypothetical protein